MIHNFLEVQRPPKITHNLTSLKTDKEAAQLNLNNKITAKHTMLRFLQPTNNNKNKDDNKESKMSEHERLEQKIQDSLHNVFKLESFRPNQHAIIKSTVIEKRDVLVLMPTGAGKSLCFQLPGVVNSGVTLVISPLIALMHDQVTALLQKNIKANFWNSTQKVTQMRTIVEDLESGSPGLKFLYTTPESIAGEKLQSTLRLLAERGQLSLVAIDEAHCISSWGHDFRPKYRLLSNLKKWFPAVPLIALTATATPKVKNDIIQTLGLKDPKYYVTSFNRPEITYEVRYKELLDSPIIDLRNFLKGYPNETGIIYCATKKQVDELCQELSTGGKLSVKAYHAGLKLSERKSVQDDWTSGKVKIVVATIAFGMGIDKKDVRFVVHWSLPKSVEGFYQESGRAGRDKKAAHSLIYYCTKDKRTMNFLLSSKSDDEKRDEIVRKDFEQVCRLCDKAHCRRKFLIEFFGEQLRTDVCKGTCDYCKDKAAVTKLIQRLNKAQDNVSFATVMGAINTKRNYLAHDDIESFSDNEYDAMLGPEEDPIADAFAARLKQTLAPRLGRAIPLSSLKVAPGGNLRISNRGISSTSSSMGTSSLLGSNGLLGSGNLLLKNPYMSMTTLKKPVPPTASSSTMPASQQKPSATGSTIATNKRPRPSEEDNSQKNVSVDDSSIKDIFATLAAEERMEHKSKRPRTTYAGVRTISSIRKPVEDLTESAGGFQSARQIQQQQQDKNDKASGITSKNSSVPNNRTIQSFMQKKKQP